MNSWNNFLAQNIVEYSLVIRVKWYEISTMLQGATTTPLNHYFFIIFL